MDALTPEIMADAPLPSGRPSMLVQVVLAIAAFNHRQIDYFPPCTAGDMLRAYKVPLALDWRVMVDDRILARDLWETEVLPAGSIVIIRLIPRAFIIPAVIAAMSAISSAAGALGGMMGITSIAGLGKMLLGELASQLIGMVGKLIMGAIAPPPHPSAPKYQADPKRYSISGTQNALAPFSQIPKVYGKRKVFPMLAARAYTEIEGHDQYLRMLFTPGYGPIEVSELKIGETDLDEYDDVDVQILPGYPDDPPQVIYTNDVQEDSLNVLLAATSDWEHKPDWRRQTSAINADELSVDLNFPKGLISYSPLGDHESMQVTVSIRYAIKDTDNWINLPDIVVTGATANVIHKSRRWTPPQKGQQWDVEMMATKRVWAGDAISWIFDTYWSAIRTIRHTAPIVMKELCLIGLRIRASNQLNGVVDQLSCVARGVIPDYDGAAWDARAGSWYYGWQQSGAAASYALDSGIVHTAGGKSLKLTTVNAGDKYGVASMAMPCQEGDGFQISGWYRSDGAHATGASLEVYWGESDDFALADALPRDATDTVMANSAVSATWAQANAKVKAPGKAKYFRIVVLHDTAPAGNIPIYWDDMAVMFLHHKQRSDDLIANNSFESLDVDKIPVDWEYDWDLAGPGPVTYKGVGAGAHEGKVGLQINPTSASDGAAVASDSIHVIAGEQFEVYGWVKGAAAKASGARMRVSYGTGPGHSAAEELSGTDIYNGALTTAWKKCDGTVTVPQGATYMRIVVYNWLTGTNVYWDDMHALPVAANFAVVNTTLGNPSFDYHGQFTDNPASIYRDILQGRANKRAISDDTRLDLAKFETWHDDNAAGGRKFNGIFDKLGTVFEAMRDVAAFGRAGYAMNGDKYSVVVDKPQSVAVQHVTPRNSWDYKGRRSFEDLPHAFKVRWINPNANWEQDELLVYADGYDAASATKFEALDLTVGCIDREQAWRDGRYHYFTGLLRPEKHEFSMDWENIVVTRGDLIRFAHDVPQFGQGWGRVKALTKDGGNNLTSVTTDERFAFDEAKSYAVRFRKSDGTSVLCNLTNPASGVQPTAHSNIGGYWVGAQVAIQSPAGTYYPGIDDVPNIDNVVELPDGSYFEAFDDPIPTRPTIRSIGAEATGNDRFPTFTRPPGYVDGDLLVVHIWLDGTPGDGAGYVKPVGWQSLRSDSHFGFISHLILWKAGRVGEPPYYDWTLDSPHWWRGRVIAIAGADTRQPIDEHVGNTNGGSTDWTLPTLIPNRRNAVIVLAFALQNVASNLTMDGPSAINQDYSSAGHGMELYDYLPGAETETNVLPLNPAIASGQPMPEVGDLCMLGLQGSETILLLVNSIEYSRDMTALLSCVNYDPAIYAAENSPPAAGDATVVPAALAPTPEAIDVRSDSSALLRDSAGVMQSRILITLKPIAATLASNLRGVQVRYREASAINPDGPWIALPSSQVDNGVVSIMPVVDRTAYDVIIRYELLDGRVGPWLEIGDHTVVGATGANVRYATLNPGHAVAAIDPNQRALVDLTQPGNISRLGSLRPFSDSFNNRGFIAVGASDANGPGPVHISDDGVAWVDGALPDNTYALRGIAEAATKIIAVGDNVILTSNDGYDWSVLVNQAGVNFRGVAVSDDKLLVAVVGYVVATDKAIVFWSNDGGVTWVGQTNTVLKRLYGVAWVPWLSNGAGGWVAVGGDPAGGMIITIAGGTPGGQESLVLAANQAPAGLNQSGDILYGVFVTDTKIVAVGGNQTILTLENGGTWVTSMRSIGGTIFKSGLWTGAKLIVCGDRVGGSNSLYTSPDGAVGGWSLPQAPARDYHAIAYDGTMIVAVSGYVATSVDGDVWTERVLGSGDNWNAICTALIGPPRAVRFSAEYATTGPGNDITLTNAGATYNIIQSPSIGGFNGGPFRVRISWGVNYKQAAGSAGTIDLWVDDGHGNKYAGAQRYVAANADDGINGAETTALMNISDLSHLAQFTLKGVSTTAGSIVKNAPAQAAGKNSWLQIEVLSAN